MKKLLSIFFGSLAIAGLPYHAAAKINIFACEPEWKALAEEIGQEKVEVISATTAHQDPHFIRAKPSLIAKMRNADLVFCSGADLEVGWLPILLQKSGSASVQIGQDGYLMASDFVKRLGVPEKLDRSEGHIHPEGNPHVHTNPHNLIKIAEGLSKRLSKIDSANADFYADSFAKFKANWSGYIKEWEAKASILKNLPVIVQHGSFLYLNDWLGIKQVADLEPKPGVPPTISHLEDLLKTIKEKNPKAILLSPLNDNDGAEWVNERADVPIVILPYTVGGSDSANNLKSLFDETINKLLEVK